MAAVLINGNGFKDVTAQRDADFYEGIFGVGTGILNVGQKMSASIVNNNVRINDGVILTREGRRIQIDYGTHQNITIPAGTAGRTAYYIVGFKLTNNADDTQTCEPFARSVASATATIKEGAFRDGASEVYVSVYRVTQSGTTNVLGARLLEYVDHVYKRIYTSLSDAGMAEPNGANGYYARMSDNSIAILTQDDIAGELPYSGAVGTVVIIRKTLSNGKMLFLSGFGHPNYEYSKDYTGGVWTNGWQALPQTYTYGDTYTWHFATAGFLTGGGRSVVFTIPVNKSLANIRNITSVQMDIKVRQRGNYLAGTATDFETVDSASYRIAENCIIATATMNSGYGGINNEACGVEGCCEVILG